MNLAYITDEIFLEHDTGLTHPESKERLMVIDEAVKSLEKKLIYLSPEWVNKEILYAVHTHEHVQSIIDASAHGLAIDSDTICSNKSYHAAVKAAGAGVAAINGIKSGNFERAFCAVRPPGHHATPTQAMGFCLFNSIAITAKYAQSIGYNKVMIIDFDVHHGNGTQDTFYDDDSVFYFSSHQALCYPGTGLETERGSGKGKGFTANYLMMPESGDDELLDIYKNDLPDHIKSFRPDIILVSAGYDLHERDPLAQLSVTTNGIKKMVRTILDSATTPFVFFLEGGYNLDDLGKNVKVTLEEMLY